MPEYSSNLAYFRVADPEVLTPVLDAILLAEGWQRAEQGQSGSLRLGIQQGGRGWLALHASEFGWLARAVEGGPIHFVQIGQALQQPGFLLASHQAAPWRGSVLIEADGRGKAVGSGVWHDQEAAQGQKHAFFDWQLDPGRIEPRTTALKTLRAQCPQGGSEEFCRHVARTLLDTEEVTFDKASLILEYRRVQEEIKPAQYLDGEQIQIGDAVLWNRGMYPARVCQFLITDNQVCGLVLQDCIQIKPFGILLRDDVPLLVTRDSSDFVADCMQQLQGRSARRDPQALTALGNLVLHGIGCIADPEQAEQMWQAAANMGYADAQYVLGLQYSHGELLGRNDANAYTLLRAASRAGHAPAALLFGKIHLEGRGVTPDARQAVRWIRQAAQGGLRDAQAALGILLSNPDYRVVNGEEAIHWLSLAAEAGDGPAQYSLGLQYARGQFVKQDFAQARAWYLKAEQAGVVEATCNLGNMAEHGHGMEVDYAVAANQYQRAAEAGLAVAMHCLGTLYQRGLGVAQDEQLAKQWLTQAAALGYRG